MSIASPISFCQSGLPAPDGCTVEVGQTVGALSNWISQMSSLIDPVKTHLLFERNRDENTSRPEWQA
jgi:hypothetical protein